MPVGRCQEHHDTEELVSAIACLEFPWTSDSVALLALNGLYWALIRNILSFLSVLWCFNLIILLLIRSYQTSRMIFTGFEYVVVE